MPDQTPQFWTVIERFAEAPALIEPATGRSLSHGALAAEADAWADRLRTLAPAGRRPVVALEIDSTPEAIAAYFGTLRAGFPLLLGEPGTLGEASRITATYQPEILVARAAPGAALEARARDCPDLQAEPHEDLCILLSTSGSTGDPKLVRLSRGNIHSNAVSIAEYLGVTAADRAMATLPWHYSYGMSVLNSYIASGASIVLTAHSVTEPAFLDEVRRTRPTSMALVPHQFDLLSHLDEAVLPTRGLRYITQAGGKLDPAMVRRFKSLGDEQGWQLVIMYGQTEAAPRISYVPPELLPEAADTIGRAIPGGRLWLRDDEGREITQTDVAGELVYEGPNVMMGYGTARGDLARGPETPELLTGDIALRTGAGLYRIVGRLKRFVKLFGLRLSLDQIEALLRERDIAGYAVAADDRLVLLCRDESRLEAAREAVAGEYGLPLSIVHAGPLPEVPLLSSGKVDMNGLRRLAEARLAEIEAQRGERGVSIAEALATATRSKTVSPSDSFTSLGGDSLGYLQVQMALEGAMGRAPTRWEEMPLAELERLAAEGRSTPSTWGSVGVDVILRVLAISLVVAQHASDLPLYGGTWILVLIMGYSVGRFQMRQIAAGHPLTIAQKMLYPIVPLYFLILAAYGLLRDEVPHEMLLVLGNYKMPDEGSFLNVLWFVSLYAQLVLVIMLFAAVPALRRLVTGRPWATLATATALVCLIVLAQSVWAPTYTADSGSYHNIPTSDFPVQHIPRRGFLECLMLFLLGWTILLAQGTRQQLATGGLCLAAVLLFLTMDRDSYPAIWLVLTMAALALGRDIPLPRVLSRLLTLLAGATLFVYLTHQVIVHLLLHILPFDRMFGDAVTALVAITGAFLAGVVLKAGFDLVEKAMMRQLPVWRQKVE